MVTLTSNTSSKILFFKGEFNQDGERWRGLTVYKDGSTWEGQLNNDKRDGPGTFYFSPKEGKIKYVGEFQDDEMHGEAMQYEDDVKEYHIEHDKGTLIKKVDLHPKVPDPKEQEEDTNLRESLLKGAAEENHEQTKHEEKREESVTKGNEKAGQGKKKK